MLVYLRIVLSKMTRRENRVMAVNEVLGGLEVPLRAFCCKARGGGGRLRHATGRVKKENVRWVLAVI